MRNMKRRNKQQQKRSKTMNKCVIGYCSTPHNEMKSIWMVEGHAEFSKRREMSVAKRFELNISIFSRNNSLRRCCWRWPNEESANDFRDLDAQASPNTVRALNISMNYRWIWANWKINKIRTNIEVYSSLIKCELHHIFNVQCSCAAATIHCDVRSIAFAILLRDARRLAVCETGMQCPIITLAKRLTITSMQPNQLAKGANTIFMLFIFHFRSNESVSLSRCLALERVRPVSTRSIFCTITI